MGVARGVARDAHDDRSAVVAELLEPQVHVALGQVQVSLDGVNVQLAKVDTMTEHAQNVSANIANLVTVVSAAAANPLVKVASFGYGLRKAAAARRHAEEEREVRAAMKQRRKAAR